MKIHWKSFTDEMLSKNDAKMHRKNILLYRKKNIYRKIFALKSIHWLI